MTFALITIFSIVTGGLAGFLLALYVLHPLAHHWFLPSVMKYSDPEEAARVLGLLRLSVPIGATAGLLWGWYLWFANPYAPPRVEEAEAQVGGAEDARFHKLHSDGK